MKPPPPRTLEGSPYNIRGLQGMRLRNRECGQEVDLDLITGGDRKDGIRHRERDGGGEGRVEERTPGTAHCLNRSSKPDPLSPRQNFPPGILSLVL